MKSYILLIVIVFLLRSYGASSSEDGDGTSLTSEIVGLLNGTYHSLDQKICELQKRVDAMNGSSGNQCGCNTTEIQEFKRLISNEVRDLSKVLSGVENDIRILKKGQAELYEFFDRNGSDANTTPDPTTTTNAPLECDSGWISSPEKCYYVSSSSEKTEWAIARDRCIAINARLAEIKTDEEASFIMNSLPDYVGSNDLFYTGRMRNDNNDWVFLSNNEVVDTFVRTWESGEPDGGAQRCGCTQKADDFNMHDCFCTEFNLFYICEIMR